MGRNAILRTRPLLGGVLALGAAALLCSCASTPVRLSAVGPKPPVIHSVGGDGYLVVYSDTQAKRLDKDMPFYVHTSYLIQRANGHTIQWVPNHLGDMDEIPQRVALPTGEYRVVAQSTSYGRVKVPVVIERGRTTVVHLEGDWKPGAEPNAGATLVRMPDGEIVGWQALVLADD